MVDEASQTTPRTVVRREVLRFAIPGAIGVVLLVTASLVAAVAVAREQSVQDAHTAAQWLVRTVVEPRIDEGLKTGSPARMAELDAAFSASISGSDVKAIRLWNEDGVIIYSNDPRLIGEQFPLPSGINDGEETQGMADVSRPENRYLDPAANWVEVSLPIVGGDVLCGEIRKNSPQVMVIMLTALDSVAQRISGLERGADDYLVKPFSGVVLRAHLRAVARRGALERPVDLTAGALTLNPATRQVRRDGVPIDLTPREFAVLEYLMRNRGRVVSKNAILRAVWDEFYEGAENIVEVYIRYLRKRIDVPFGVASIETVRGAGYRLADT